MNWSKYRQPAIDAVTVLVAALLPYLVAGNWGAVLSAVIAVVAVGAKALNPVDTSYGIGAQKPSQGRTEAS